MFCKFGSLEDKRPVAVTAISAAIVVILGGLLLAHTRRPPEEVERVVFVEATPVDGLGASPAEPRNPDPIDPLDPLDPVDPPPVETVRILTVGDSVMDQVGGTRGKLG